jgi:lipopolysaccharide heptosyltransferase II
VPPRILVVRLSSMGDILLTTPLLRALRERHPAAHITYVTRRAFAPLLEHNPRLTEVIALAPGGRLRPLARALRERRFTHALDLHGSLRSRALRWLVPLPWRGYPRHRLARTVLIRTGRDVYRDRRPVAERYFDAARGLDVRPDGKGLECFIPRGTMDKARQFLAATGLGGERALVALAPGAAHATKRWPLRHWQALAAALTAQGRDVVVAGGPGDVALADAVAAAGAPHAASAAGRFDPAGSGALLKQARCVVSGDTGLMHLAAAVGTPVVALFGPTVPAFGFTPYQARATVLERDLPCRPCSAMGGPRCPIGTHACLEELLPAEVFEAVRRLPR